MRIEVSRIEIGGRNSTARPSRKIPGGRSSLRGAPDEGTENAAPDPQEARAMRANRTSKKTRRFWLQPHTKWADKLIALYHDELSDEESELVEHHLNECVTCAKAYLVYHEVADILHGVPRLEPPLEQEELLPRLQEMKEKLFPKDAQANQIDDPDVDPPPLPTPADDPSVALVEHQQASGAEIKAAGVPVLSKKPPIENERLWETCDREYLLGKEIGPYRLIRMLGAGPLSAVYVGKHLQRNTEVAVKVWFLYLAERAVRDFFQEEHIIAGLEHPHILQILNSGVLEAASYPSGEGMPYQAMRYAPNGSLRQKYPPGSRLPLHTIILYLQQIVDALQYAHDQNIVHLDLKPENILLDKQGEVLLADFGIARLLQLETGYSTSSGFVGAPAYAAPEQFQEGGLLGPASDQYALAAMVYEWLTGTWPFEGDGPTIAYQKLTQDPPPLRKKLPTIPAAVEQIILQALAKDARARFASVREFAARLERANPEPLVKVKRPQRMSRS